MLHGPVIAKRCLRWFPIVALLFFVPKGFSMSTTQQSWKFLAPLPQAIAGQCVGRAGDVLVVAGGSSWTAPPWANGVKSWSPKVYALHTLDGQWKEEKALAYGMGYGASAQWGDSLLCVGGQDATKVFDTVLRFHEVHGNVEVEHLPKLPKPITNAGAAVVDDVLYVVGGQHDVTPASVSKEIWSLSLKGGKFGEWKQEPTSPWGHSRILPVAVGCGHELYVMSGADLQTGAYGAPIRTYLKDAWKRTAAGKWEAMPELPAAVVAASGLCGVNGNPIVFSGDDGVLAPQAQVLRDKHPGFSRSAHELVPATEKWHEVSKLPVSLVTTAATTWKGHYVIAGGEPQPGHRSDKVIAFQTGH